VAVVAELKLKLKLAGCSGGGLRNMLQRYYISLSSSCVCAYILILHTDTDFTLRLRKILCSSVDNKFKLGV